MEALIILNTVALIVIAGMWFFKKESEVVELQETPEMQLLLDGLNETRTRCNDLNHKHTDDYNKLVEAYNMLAAELGLEYMPEEIVTTTEKKPARIVKIKNTRKSTKK